MLFCKPSKSPQLLYEQKLGHGELFGIRSLDMAKDIEILNHWVNQPYSKEFWQLDGPVTQLKKTYRSLLNNPHAHSFIGLLNGTPVCQIDLYRIQADELAAHIPSNYDDCGMHLLMGPYEKPITHLSSTIMEAFMHFFFSFHKAEHLYAEPDYRNTKACRLLKKCGFSLLQQIALINKTANLYLMTRNQFHETYPLA